MYHPHQTLQNKTYKINNSIVAKELRVIGDDSKQIGILSRDEALDYALGQGLDLVLITETANPPVAKVIDYKKFLYQENKKGQEAKKNQKATGIKEVRVGSSFAGVADVTARIVQTKKFLAEGHLVKVSVKFAGRAITHPEFGHKIFARFKTDLEGAGKVDREAHFEGKHLVATFSPVK